MAVTRIKNNQITDNTIEYQKIKDGTLVGAKFNSNLTLNSNLTIVGNLSITGNTTTIDSVNTTVNDPILVFNHGYTGSLAGYSIGLLVNRNLASLSSYGSVNTAWVWDENTESFVAIATTNTGTGITNLNNSGWANVKVGNLTVVGSASFASLSGNLTGNISATSLFSTNFSTGNAVITGGYADNYVIGANTPATGNFTTANATSVTGYNATITTVNTTTGNVTTLNSTTVNAGTATTATLNTTSGNATTLVSTNFSTGNAAITGGAIDNTSVGATTASTGNFTTANATAFTGYNATVATVNSTTGNITTVNSTTVNAGTATAATLNTTSGNATTLVSTNFSTGNARITGGYADNYPIGANTPSTGNFTTANATSFTGYDATVATVNSTTGNITTVNSTTVNAGTTNTADLNATNGNVTTLVSTNFSTGNARITGGYADNYPIGANTPSTGNFTTANATSFTGYNATVATVNSTTGNITTVNSTTVNAGTTTTATLNTTSGNATTLVSTNLSSGNAVVTGGSVNNTVIGNTTPATGNFTTANATSFTGYNATVATVNSTTGNITTVNSTTVNATTVNAETTTSFNLNSTNGNITTLGAGTATAATLNATNGNVTTLVATNFSSGNARITGGYIDNTPIGANTRSSGAFTTLASNGLTTFTNATESDSPSTGAVVVTGGVGVGANLNVAGNVTITGNLTILGNTTTINTETLSVEDLNVTVAANAASGAAANGAGLTVAGANATFTYLNADDSWNLNKKLNATTVDAAQINVTNANITTLTFTSAAVTTLVATNFSTANALITGGSLNNTVIGNTTPAAGTFNSLRSTGNIVADSGQNATNYTTGALVVPGGGGVGITGDLWVQGPSTFAGNIVAGNIVLSGNINVPVGGTFSNTGVFFGNAGGIGALYAGTTTYTALPTTVLQLSGNVDTYAQVNFQNINSGANASTDLVLTADNGNDNDGYINLGIDSSNYNNPGFPGFYPNDAYLIHHSALSTGNLVIFSHTEGSAIKFHVGEYGDSNVKVTVTNNGLRVNTATASTSTTSGALLVAGGAGISGDLYAASVITGNAGITGGSLNNTVIGNVTPATGNFTTANATSVTGYNATITIVNSTTGNITNLTSTTVDAGTTTTATLNTTSGNATTLVATNLSSGNAVITGGSLNNTVIGNTTPVTGNFTTANASAFTGYTATVATVNSTTGNITNLTSATIEAGTTTTATLNATGGNVTTLVATNFGSGNARITGGYADNYPIGANTPSTGNFTTANATAFTGYTATVATVNSTTGNITTLTSPTINGGTTTTAILNNSTANITDAKVTTLVATNFSSGNAQISGGYADGFTLGGNTAASAKVTTLVASGNIVADSGTASTSNVTGALVVSGTGGAGIGGNLNVGYGAAFNTSKTAAYDFVVKGKSDDTLVWGRAGSAYDQVIIGNSATTSTLVTGAKLIINTTDSFIIPVGTTAQRPGSTGGTDTRGMLRFNISNGGLEVYDGAEWDDVGGGQTIVTSDAFSGDDVTTIFTLSQTTTTAAAIVSINGVVQIPTTAYSISGTTLTFTEAPATGDSIEVRTLVTSTTAASLSSPNGNVTIATNNDGSLFQAGTTSGTNRYKLNTNGAWETLNANTAVASANTATTVDSFYSNTYRSARYTAQASTTGGKYQVSELVVVHDDTTAYVTEYGVTQTNGNVGTFVTTITSGSVLVQFVGENANTNVRLTKNYIII
jgi:hypothetical protein